MLSEMVIYAFMKQTMQNFSGSLIKGVLNAIYPPRCLNCNAALGLFNNEILCGICYGKIRLNRAPFCKRCGRSSAVEGDSCSHCATHKYNFDRAYSACIYEGVIRECIHKFKYNSSLQARGLFYGLMSDFAQRYLDMINFDLIIPIPLHRVKLRQRTFNQSKILAKNISDRFGIPLLENNLIKTRFGKPQIKLQYSQRFKEIKDSFKMLRPFKVKDKACLLIDDVFTTGATANECSRVLRGAGASKVIVFTLANGI